MAEGFWTCLVSKSLTSLFCISDLRAHSTQLIVQTLKSILFLTLRASHQILISVLVISKKSRERVA